MATTGGPEPRGRRGASSGLAGALKAAAGSRSRRKGGLLGSLVGHLRSAKDELDRDSTRDIIRRRRKLEAGAEARASERLEAAAIQKASLISAQRLMAGPLPEGFVPKYDAPSLGTAEDAARAGRRRRADMIARAEACELIATGVMGPAVPARRKRARDGGADAWPQGYSWCEPRASARLFWRPAEHTGPTREASRRSCGMLRQELADDSACVDAGLEAMRGALGGDRSGSEAGGGSVRAGDAPAADGVVGQGKAAAGAGENAAGGTAVADGPTGLGDDGPSRADGGAEVVA